MPGSGQIAPRYALGIDIGGTFTDLVLHDPDGGVVLSHKELTTPEDPAIGTLAGLRALFAQAGSAAEGSGRLDPARILRIVHATTLFTNALIERRGAVTGLLTTQGFRDVLEIARERKYELYDIFLTLPAPLVPRHLRREVPERTAPDGGEVLPLDEAVLLAEARALVDAGATSLAVVLLHSYANPAHERQAGALLRETFPGIAICLSSDIAPEIREYERSSTTVANAYIAPLAERYLHRLGEGLRSLGIGADLSLMLSNGGLTHLGEALSRPIEMLESGPAAGALAAAFFGGRSAMHHVLAFDMGGTTAKLSVVEDGVPVVAHAFEAARERRFVEGSGLPINISTVELIEIGAGGGSIASLDELGLLKVGPRSAGSRPGPACYGRGGSDPTVTDANLLLGYLEPASFAGGTMRLDVAAAERAMAGLASRAGLSVMQLAWGVHDLVNETMAGAARMHVAERGVDPRRFALLTTGGGGPLHGCAVARKLGLSTLICPPSAGVASALGLLVAPARVDRVASVPRPLAGIDWQELESRFRALEADAVATIAGTGVDPAAAIVTRQAEMRYAGQGFEVLVGLASESFGTGADAELLQRFEAEYGRVFGRIPPRGEAEFVNIRVSVQAALRAGVLPGTQPGGELQAASRGTRPAWIGGGFVETPVYVRAALGAGLRIIGPALVEEPGATLLLPRGSEARVEGNGNIRVELA